jgi:feruloyl esterase
MIEKIIVDQNIDRRRVFVTGLSAGGAMTSVMLACYPEIFAGGAIIAGLPYGTATNVKQAFESMYQSPTRSAEEWANLVRRAAAHTGPWPRISVWHGNADKTVIPSNAREILKQWTEIHGLPITPSREAMVDGYPRQVWVDAAGKEIIESYTITHMAHGTPLSTGEGEDECGAAGPFLLETGISSSYHIAKFFGLISGGLRIVETTESKPVGIAPEQGFHTLPTAPAQPPVQEADLLEQTFESGRENAYVPSPSIDVGAVITKALQAAGLMRDR